jgi:hypothetical protein
VPASIGAKKDRSFFKKFIYLCIRNHQNKIIMIQIIIIFLFLFLALYIYSYRHRLTLKQYFIYKIVFGVIAFGFLFYNFPKRPYGLIIIILFFLYSLYKDYREIKEFQ